MTLRDGYDRSKNPKTAEYRPMTAEEAKTLQYGDHVPFLANDGTARIVKINGHPRTWKGNPKVEVPTKYGMYDYATMRSCPDGTMERLLVKV